MFTFGAELEYADFNRELAKKSVTEWGVVDVNDVTVVNSDGSVGGEHNTIGGEIVTKICMSPQQLAEYCTNIVDSLDKYEINYSCWLHIHVGHPSLQKPLSLDKLKSILENTFYWQHQLLSNTTINPPKIHSDGSVDVKRNQTRTSVPTYEEYLQSMEATTVEDFWKPLERKRHLINIRPLRSYGTIEYRFLPATDKLNSFKDAALMVQEITSQILSENPLDSKLKVIYNGYHMRINERLEAEFRAQKVAKTQKVDNFTGDIWNG